MERKLARRVYGNQCVSVSESTLLLMVARSSWVDILYRLEKLLTSQSLDLQEEVANRGLPGNRSRGHY